MRVNVCYRNVLFILFIFYDFSHQFDRLTSKSESPPSPVSCLFLLLDSTFTFGLHVEFGFSRAVGWTDGSYLT